MHLLSLYLHPHHFLQPSQVSLSPSVSDFQLPRNPKYTFPMVSCLTKYTDWLVMLKFKSYRTETSYKLQYHEAETDYPWHIPLTSCTWQYEWVLAHKISSAMKNTMAMDTLKPCTNRLINKNSSPSKKSSVLVFFFENRKIWILGVHHGLPEFRCWLKLTGVTDRVQG